MLSQYSWGDFFKVVIPIALLYYAYVAWKYYREDIRDWFSGSKEENQPAQAPADEEEEVDASEFFSSKTYSTNQPEPTPSNETSTTPPDEASTVDEDDDMEEVDVADEPIPQPQSYAKPIPVDVEISEGVVVAQEAPTLDFALTTTPVLPAERSLADVLNAAKRVSLNNEGVYAATAERDTQADELATTLNEQKGLGNVLTGVAFTR